VLIAGSASVALALCPVLLPTALGAEPLVIGGAAPASGSLGPTGPQGPNGPASLMNTSPRQAARIGTGSLGPTGPHGG